jgi:hypothetical protein
VILGADVDCNFNVVTSISDEYALLAYFGDPMHAHIPGKEMRKPEAYLSVREHETAVSELETLAIRVREYIDARKKYATRPPLQMPKPTVALYLRNNLAVLDKAGQAMFLALKKVEELQGKNPNE